MSKLDNLGIDRQELVQLYREALLKFGTYEEVEAEVSKKLTRLVIAEKVQQNIDDQHSRQLKKSVPRIIRFGASSVPIFLIVVGLFLLGSAVVPIAGFYLRSLPTSPALIAPIPKEEVISTTPYVVAQTAMTGDLSQEMGQIKKGPVIVDAELDYTNLSNWFENQMVTDLVNRTSLLSQQVGEYILEIPELDVNNAVVKIGGVNLDESLIQYPGTSLPGKPGSPVIFGHSILRRFYNPKETNPRRYNSIFSTIMTLEPGDRIYLIYNDVKYTYTVIDKKEVKPTDTYILSQDYDSSQLKLVTCVPEGTYLRRGVVTAQLVKE